eukprot:TRINITY_DN60977_c0_g1_i1.p1 TRINITY_DN60977_c0_g1~~TRINITY_DN60977_c0_g1_i1.p1  ORF type:complete len:380 (+),score=115.22 TRINITY_DN60977_c0_g1_i1:69-1142(+)
MAPAPEAEALSDAFLHAAPTAPADAHGVPVIDVAALCHGAGVAAMSPDHPLVRDIAKACEGWGFFQAVNHGIPQQLVDEFHSQMRKFFYVRKELKQRIKRTQQNSRGWADDELTKQRRDWKELLDIGAQDGSLDKSGLDGHNQWPDPSFGLPDFEPVMRRWFEACRQLSARLVDAMGLGLGLPAGFFAPEFTEHTSYLRLNYYPTCPDPDGHLSISHHTDAGAVTVLTQSMVKSLQVFHHPSRTWHFVQPIPGAVVINTGDIMQVWSNDRYRAPLHRVKAQLRDERWSAPFFYNPNYRTNYAPVYSTVTPETPARYRPINWGEFRMKRFAGDYADVGEEAQVSHYRIAAPPKAASRM